MHDIPKKQAQNLLVDPLATILKDTYPNLRQATFQEFRLATNPIFQPHTLGGLNGRNSYLG